MVPALAAIFYFLYRELPVSATTKSVVRAHFRAKATKIESTTSTLSLEIPTVSLTCGFCQNLLNRGLK